MRSELLTVPNLTESPPDTAWLSRLFAPAEDARETNRERILLRNYLHGPLRSLEKPHSIATLTSLHEGLVRVHTPVMSFVTDLMERAQYKDGKAMQTLRNFSNWYRLATVHKGQELGGKSIHLSTIAGIAATVSTEDAMSNDFSCISELPSLLDDHVRLLYANRESKRSPRDDSNVWERDQNNAEHECNAVGRIISRILTRDKRVVGPSLVSKSGVLSSGLIQLADALTASTAGSGASLTTLGLNGSPTVRSFSHALGHHIVQMAKSEDNRLLMEDTTRIPTHIECLPMGDVTFAIFRYQGTENKKLSHTIGAEAIRQSLQNMPEPISPVGIAACMRICFGDLPANHEETTQSVRQGIISATRALHTRGHRDDFGGARNSALKRIGVDSLTFRQRGQEFDIDIAYHGSMLPLHVDADGTVRFPPDIHDPEARAKIELIALSHLGEILDIHRKPREEPSTTRGGGKPKPYRGRYLQIQPEGKRTRQLAKPSTNASVQDWLELPTADMTWINLAFNLAQEATHLAHKPSDEFASYLIEQDVPPIVAAKVTDLMQRLKDRKMWPPIEGKPLVTRQVSFVDEMKDIPGTGPIDTNTARAAKQYREILPPTPKVPVAGTVYSAPNSS